MDSNTTQLAIVMPDSEIDETPKRGWRNRSHAPKKHRIQDYVSRLERDLALSQQLNETLSANLTAQIAETTAANERFDRLMERVEDLDRRLRVAENANVANSRGVDFSFQQRQVDGYEDQATMPVPQVELLADGPSLKITASDAAAALLDRIVPMTQREIALVPAYAPPAPVEVFLPNEELTETAEETELYSSISTSWGARQPQVQSPVAWGGPSPSSRALSANMSTTGTFLVTPLHQRGTGPTAVPGFAV
jgi:hypothetical protein